MAKNIEIIYCIHCGKLTDKNQPKCQHCGNDLILDNLDQEQTRTFSKSLHNRLNASREEVDNAMVFVVLGSTFLIIGILFFFLSFKLPDATALYKEISLTCFEFYVSMAGLIAGGTMLTIGLIRLIKQKAVVQREIIRTLRLVQNDKYKHNA